MNARILIIDDDPSLLGLTKEVLEGASYNVLVASNGLSGIFLFKSCSSSISCVICDIELPDLSGFKIVSKLRSIDPAVPILVWSGHDDKLKEMSENGHSILAKPFRIEALLSAIDSLKRELPLA